ncbi:MAG TPA: TIGR00730 family Rossman fold protein [Parachlamydiaceae bacterium]|nr:TIGR00730 family Rossman fold protein [Parachlamydiaceae bacterium]
MMTEINVKEEHIQKSINELITLAGADADTFESQLIAQIIETSLKLLHESHDTGQLKLISRSLRELRYAYRVFNAYKGIRRISIFGSARTGEQHADYKAAKDFGELIAHQEWMCITGGANGIMKAGLEGASRESSFGLSIRLPFEVPTNTVIEGDPKLIVFRYFFTRKLMFMSHSDAVAVFPGGVGTLDELFEVLTLIQTGKANIVPVVLMEGEGGVYWEHWQHYLEEHLLANGWISPSDFNLFYRAPTGEAGVEHILKFYRRYHSSRYVEDKLIIRMLEPISEADVEELNERFSFLVKSGKIEQRGALEEETDHLELPRLVFHHTRSDFGSVRALIDAVNNF